MINVDPSQTVRQALNLMSTYNISQLPVLDGGECVGSVSEGALMAKAMESKGSLDSPVRETMEAPYPIVDAKFPLDSFSELLSRETPAALVKQNGEISGIITRYDVLRQVAGIR